MTIYFAPELLVCLAAAAMLYLGIGVVIAVLAYADPSAGRPWGARYWLTAVCAGPLLMLGLLIELWALDRNAQAKRRTQR